MLMVLLLVGLEIDTMLILNSLTLTPKDNPEKVTIPSPTILVDSGDEIDILYNPESKTNTPDTCWNALSDVAKGLVGPTCPVGLVLGLYNPTASTSVSFP